MERKISLYTDLDDALRNKGNVSYVESETINQEVLVQFIHFIMSPLSPQKNNRINLHNKLNSEDIILFKRYLKSSNANIDKDIDRFLENIGNSSITKEELKKNITDISTMLTQEMTFIETFQSAYFEYLKLSTIGVDNIAFPYLPVRNSTVNITSYPVPLKLDNMPHLYGLPTFSDSDGSRDLLYKMADQIRNSNYEVTGASREEYEHYNRLLNILDLRIEQLDPLSNDLNARNNISEFFYVLNQTDSRGKKIIDGLIECNNINIRVRTLDLINKILFYTYKERKVDLELLKISRPDEIRNDMAYQIFSLRNTNIDLYKAFFESPPSQELIDFVSNHASKHYTNMRSANDLIKEGRKEFLRLTTMKIINQYEDGSLNSNKIDIQSNINNTINKYYTVISKELKNKDIDVEKIETKLYEEELSITDLLIIKYYFENNKNDPNYDYIRNLFMEKYELKSNFSIDKVINNQFLSISKDFLNGKGNKDDIKLYEGFFNGVHNKITTGINSSNIGTYLHSTNNYTDIIDYINLNEEDFEGYKHSIIDLSPSIDFIRSKYLHGKDNFSDLINIKSKLVSSVVKHVIAQTPNISTAIGILKKYYCGNYLDIMNAILDTPECLEKLENNLLDGKEVFNMSRITQKCDDLAGLGDIIDNDSNIKIMTAVEDVYFSDTGRTAEKLPDEESDAIENFILFIPQKESNEGTSIYLELKEQDGSLALIPAHVYLHQRLEYHNYGGKSRTGITVHVNHSSQHLPKDERNAHFVASSSAAQQAQLREMLDYEPSTSISSGSNRIGGTH